MCWRLYELVGKRLETWDWLIASRPWTPGDVPSYLQLVKGDLVVLDAESQGETVLNGGWCSGRNERTGDKGDFPSEVVYIIPAMSKPPPDILVSAATGPISFAPDLTKWIPIELYFTASSFVRSRFTVLLHFMSEPNVLLVIDCSPVPNRMSPIICPSK